MSVSRQIRDRNALAAKAREEERKEKERLEQLGQEFRSRKEETVRRLFNELSREGR